MTRQGREEREMVELEVCGYDIVECLRRFEGLARTGNVPRRQACGACGLDIAVRPRCQKDDRQSRTDHCAKGVLSVTTRAAAKTNVLQSDTIISKTRTTACDSGVFFLWFRGAVRNSAALSLSVQTGGHPPCAAESLRKGRCHASAARASGSAPVPLRSCVALGPGRPAPLGLVLGSRVGARRPYS